MELREKLRSRKAHVVIAGLGYVGLPLAVKFAEAGFRVTGIDMQAEKVKKVNSGISYIDDVDGRKLKKTVSGGQFRAVSDFSVVKKADAVIICVPTPLTANKTPDISYVENVTREIRKYLHAGLLVVLESTTYPGTTEEVLKPILEETGLKAGRDFYLVFSPERVDPGVKDEYHVSENIPKVIGGLGKKDTELAGLLYGAIVKKVHPVSSPKVAEMEKLLENIFRVVNISLVNEMALLCDRLKIDIWEVIEAAATKPYGFMPFYPGPGLGGHCIPIDPFYLTWKAKEYDVSSGFIELAGEINDNMPNHVVTKITGALNSQKKCLMGSRIFILGVAYKKNIRDTRESPVLKIMDMLERAGAAVAYNDPYVPVLKRGAKTLRSVKLTGRALKAADLVLIATDHDVYDAGMILKHSRLIMDARNKIRKRGLSRVFGL